MRHHTMRSRRPGGVLAALVAALACIALLGVPTTARADGSSGGGGSSAGAIAGDLNQSLSARARQVEAALRSAVASHQETVDVSSFNASQDEVKAACTALVTDPDVYTLYPQYTYTYETGTGRVLTVTLSYAVPTSQLADYERRVEAKVSEALSWTSASMDDAHKAQTLHDYLVRNCRYDSAGARDPSSAKASYSAIGALVDGKAVCQGYSDAYSLLLSRAGIASEYVASSSMNHGWNMVRIGGSWYHVDVTWDDLVAQSDQGFDADVSHQNFLRSDSTFRALGHRDWAASHTAPADYQMTYATYKGPWATQAMYRLYNPNSGEHFYTANAAERNSVIAAGWKDEGIGWTAPVSSGSPVYRLYNPNAGDHHYTLDSGERDHLISVGWKDEGIGWYSDDSKQVPLYRQYNPNAKAGAHNFTTATEERDHLVSVGWKDEGIGWYGVRQ